MRSGFSRVIRAVSFFLGGMALLFSACQISQRMPEGPFALEEKADNLFHRAEDAYQAEDLEAALRDYTLYFQKYPGGKNAGTALYRMAWILYTTGRDEEALALFQRMVRDYPEHTWLPSTYYNIAAIHYRLEHNEESAKWALECLNRYPGHPLKGEILLLLAKNAMSLGNRTRAMYWGIKADEQFRSSGSKSEELSEWLFELIQECSPSELREMADHTAESPYAPVIYHRLALLYLEAHDLEAARETAMALVRSTPEQRWVSLGRQILEEVEGALSVRIDRIGCLLPLSGPFSIYGHEVLNGIQLGMELSNGSGYDQELELIIRDTAGDVDETLSQFEDLAENSKVIAVIGPLASKTSQAAAQKAQQLGVPIITLTQRDGIAPSGDMVFRNFLTPYKEVHRLLEKTVYDLGMTRFAILYPDNSYGRVLMNLFFDGVEERGCTVTSVEAYDPQETDFAGHIKKMVGLYYPVPESVKQMSRQKKAQAGQDETEREEEGEPGPIVDFDAVFIPDSSQQVALIAPQFPFHSVFNVRFLGTSLWQSPELIAQTGDYIQGAIFTSGFYTETESDQIREFVAAYREVFEAEPGLLAATGFDTIRFLEYIMKEGGIRTRKDLQERLLSSEGLQGVTGKIAFDTQGEVVKDPILLTVSGPYLDILP